MELKQLKYFLTICEEKNISRAAKKLFISQPPLSIQLKKLEEELGCELFRRTTRHLEITPAGKILEKKAMQILELSENLLHEVRSHGEKVSGTLSVGLVASSGATLLPERIPKFYEVYSDINFKIKEGSTHRILEFLDNGIIEIGIVRSPFNEQKYDCIHLVKEPMVAIASKKHFKGFKKENFKIEDLKNLPLILDKRFYKLISSACEKNGFFPNILCEGEDSRSLLRWASSGLGIAILPKSITNLTDTNNMLSFTIDSEDLETNIIIVWIKNRPLSPVAKKFIETFYEETLVLD